MSCTYGSEDVDVLVAGDQMGVLSRACGRFELVSCQHPNLHRKQNNMKQRYCFGFIRCTEMCNYMKQNVCIISVKSGTI